MVRVVFTGDDLRGLPEIAFTDHYVKLLLPPAGADYSWPFDPERIKETHPSDSWPVTRTYTIRWFDRSANELAIDFVVHGSEGLAGPWAASAKAGDGLSFYGPGGAYAPDSIADSYLFVGDEAALPAIAAALDALAPDAVADVFLEVASAAHQQPLTVGPNTSVTWVYRADSGLGYGEPLAAAVLAAPLAEGRIDAFVHGNAEMVKVLRRFLLVENRIPKSQVSISGYWRTGHTEDRWQATKRDFNAAMETEAPLS